MKIPIILILFGGESPEHDVSISSARNVADAIDDTVVTPKLCYIDRSGRWWHVAEVRAHTAEELTMPLVPLLGQASVQTGDTTIKIGAIMPILHGRHGEDGSVQGLARLLHVPIVGCDIDASAMGIDKVLTKQMVRSVGIPTVPHRLIYRHENVPPFNEIQAALGKTLFIKPARLGSSVGIHKVSNAAAYQAAVTDALSYDTKVLIEAAIESPRELEVAVLGPAHDPRVSVVGEIVPDREFYDYASKYDHSSSSQALIPATDLSDHQVAMIRTMTADVYRTLQCRGLARIDFFMQRDGEDIWLNEINTMPGFTDISMYPKLWIASGMSYRQLVMQLITDTLDSNY